MPKKIIVVGDIHFRDKKLDDIASAWDRLVSHAHNKGFDLIACAGDVFDHVNVSGKEATVGTIYNAFMEPFLKQPKPIRTVLIFGNHDIGDAFEKDALSPLEGCPWVTVIRKPGVHDVMDGFSICALPWISREVVAARMADARKISLKEAVDQASSSISSLPDRLRVEVKEKTESGKFVLFLGHMEVTGAKMSNGEAQANGNFEFDPPTLSSIGANAYALGHIHVRQKIPGLPNANDGYLGTLCQLSFGEEGNNTGCRSLTIEGTTIVGDSWLENKASPRYVTVETLEGLSVRPEDYVKLRAEEKPDDLPAGVIFDKVVKNKDFERRTDGGLNADSPTQTLLSEWKESSKCDVAIEKLLAGAEAIRSEIGPQGDAIGSLDSLDSVTLDNVTCYGHATFDFPKGVIAIEGPNGSGKTTLVEALIVALYGKSPSRPSVSSLVSQGKTDGRFEVTFTSGGKQYVVTREVKVGLKSSSSKAFLREQGASENIAGPKVEEVEKKCMTLVGDVDMVMSGIFSSQGDGGSLVDVRSADRKELFAKLLGTHKFLSMADLAKKKAGAESASAISSAEIAKRLKEALSTEEEDKKKLSDSKDGAATISKEIDEGNEKLGTAKEGLVIAESANRKRQEVIVERKKVEAKRDEVTSKARELKTKRDAIGDMDVVAIEKKLSKARSAETDLARIEADLQKYNALRQSKQSEVDKLRSEAEKTENARKLSHAEAVSSAMGKAAAAHKERASGRLLLDAFRQETAVKLEKLRARLDEASKKVDRLKGFPDADICNSCDFAKDGLESRAKIGDFERAIPRGESILAKSETQIKEYDEETERITKALSHTPDLPSWQPEVVASVKAILDDADKKEEDLPTVPESLVKKKKEAEDASAALKDLEKEMEDAMKKKDDFSKLDSSIAELKTKFDDLNESLDGMPIPEIVDESPSRALAKSLSDEISVKTRELSEANRLIGQWEARVEEHAKRKVEFDEVEKNRKESEERAAVMAALAKAFGRDGIPQLIVDGALPRFQEIMSNLLSEFEKGWSIQVRSQRVTKSETVQEAIDIMVDSGLGERDIGTYSGGEKKILKSIVRISFATLQAERTGKGLKVLVMDEATDHMDDENAETTIRMLGSLKCFNQVIVISHHTRVLGEIINKIRLGIS